MDFIQERIGHGVYCILPPKEEEKPRILFIRNITTSVLVVEEYGWRHFHGDMKEDVPPHATAYQ